MAIQKVEPALYAREQSADRLSCSVSQIIRLERRGKLTPIKPSGQPTSRVYHRVEQVEALARGEQADA